MPFTQLNRENLAIFKRCLRTIWPSVGSSHADEAIAALAGYRTYAALLKELPVEPKTLPFEPQPQKLMDRLAGLGHALPPQEIDRVMRLFESEMMARIWENIRRISAQPANDNR